MNTPLPWVRLGPAIDDPTALRSNVGKTREPTAFRWCIIMKEITAQSATCLLAIARIVGRRPGRGTRLRLASHSLHGATCPTNNDQWDNHHEMDEFLNPIRQLGTLNSAVEGCAISPGTNSREIISLDWSGRRAIR